VHSFRASLAIVLFAALAASPVLDASVHHSTAKSHAAHSSRSAHANHSSIATHRSDAAASQSADAPHSSRATRHGHKAIAAKARRTHGQQAIDSERVTQIQQALIREHYLSGDATGSWDDSTKAAMQKYQADQGWQTKLMPDSRALKKLGLGPDYSNAINAKDSSFAAPPPASTIPAGQAAGFAAAAGVKE
jgi:hypothetical protein